MDNPDILKEEMNPQVLSYIMRDMPQSMKLSKTMEKESIIHMIPYLCGKQITIKEIISYFNEYKPLYGITVDLQYNDYYISYIVDTNTNLPIEHYAISINPPNGLMIAHTEDDVPEITPLDPFDLSKLILKEHNFDILTIYNIYHKRTICNKFNKTYALNKTYNIIDLYIIQLDELKKLDTTNWSIWDNNPDLKKLTKIYMLIQINCRVLDIKQEEFIIPLDPNGYYEVAEDNNYIEVIDIMLYLCDIIKDTLYNINQRYIR